MGILLSYLKNIMTVKITSKVSFDMLSDITQYFERVRLEIVEKNDPIYVTQQINTDVNVLSGFVIANFVFYSIKYDFSYSYCMLILLYK